MVFQRKSFGLVVFMVLAQVSTGQCSGTWQEKAERHPFAASTLCVGVVSAAVATITCLLLKKHFSNKHFKAGLIVSDLQARVDALSQIVQALASRMDAFSYDEAAAKLVQMNVAIRKQFMDELVKRKKDMISDMTTLKQEAKRLAAEHEERFSQLKKLCDFVHSLQGADGVPVLERIRQLKEAAEVLNTELASKNEAPE